MLGWRVARVTRMARIKRFAGVVATLAWAAATCALAAGCPDGDRASGGASSDASSATTSIALPKPAAPGATEGSVKRLDAGALVPLQGRRVTATGGDWVLELDGRVAVVSRTTGALIDFGARGAGDELVQLESHAFDALDVAKTELVAIEPEGAHVLAVRRRVLGKPLALTTFYFFADGALAIESVLSSTGAATLAITLGETIAWGNVPTWVEGHGFVPLRAGTYSGAFIAREGFGVAYAFESSTGRTVARFGSGDPGFHDSARTGEETVSVPANGEAPRRRVSLAFGVSIGEAASRLPSSVRAGIERWALPSGLAPNVGVEVARCNGAASNDPNERAKPDERRARAPYARFAPGTHELALPKGCFVARLVALAHAAGPWTKVGELASGAALALGPRAGRVKLSATEKGAGAIPARALFRGVAPTPDPSFGEDPIDGAVLDVVYFDHATEVALAPGKYRVLVTRGFEYTARAIDIDVKDGGVATVLAELERVVDTRGWIAADLHVHAVASPDAPALLADRVRSLAASGVEVAVATDHNAITDYGPTIRERNLSPFITSIVGDEITTRGTLFGHFNAFPLDPLDAPIAVDAVTPKALFAAARAAAPNDRDKVLQVNHPRMGDIGYFELLRFDRNDVLAWTKRSPLADTSFDALEVFNGDHYAALDKVEDVMRDWYALLDAGIRVTATGNSDSHKLAYHEAGVPRNLVLVGEDSPAKVDEKAFIDAVRKGRVVVSSGPFVKLEANGKSIGDEIAPGEVDVSVRVEAPPWIDVERVDVVGRGGAVLATIAARAGTGEPRVVRVDAHLKLTLAKGDWIVAVARGAKPMTFLHRPGATPFAFTNAIFVR